MSRKLPEIDPKVHIAFQLGQFVFDTTTKQLQNDSGNRVSLRSQSQQVLAQLLETPGQVVSKDELISSIWQDTFVTDDSLVQCISDIRRAIGDAEHSIIQTLPKQGYIANAQRITGPKVDEPAAPGAVKPLRQRALLAAAVSFVVLIAGAFAWWQNAAPDQAEPRAVPLPSGPRIAIIPFRNLSENEADAFFSEGLTRDIIAQLARFSNLLVIAQEAGELFRDNPDCSLIRKELSADYILTGTVQRYEDRMRVTTGFLDAKTCLQLTPPGPFDRDTSVDSVLDIQLEIARKVAAEVGSGDAPLFNSEVQREISSKAPDELQSYECVLLSYWFYQDFGLDSHRKARDCLQRSVEEEPHYSLGWSRLAFTYLESKKRGHDTPENWAELARSSATRAIEADRLNPDAYYALAILSRMEGADKSVFLETAQKAISLNPNESWILADLGIFLAYSGEWVLGKEWISRARALNPKLHRGFTNAWVLHAFVDANYAEARDLLLSMGIGDKHPMGRATLTAAYAKAGDQAEAAESADILRDLFPAYLDNPRAPYQARGMPTDLVEGLMEGLALAGLEVPPA